MRVIFVRISHYLSGVSDSVGYYMSVTWVI